MQCNAMRYAQNLDFICVGQFLSGSDDRQYNQCAKFGKLVHPFNSITQSVDGYANANYVNENPCCKMSTWTAIAKS